MDQADALGHRFDLGQPVGAIQRVALAVDVGLAHIVQIDQGDGANARTGQRLSRPGAYATHTYDTYLSRSKLM